jgi:exosome complex RNA-binding protein Rrp42 (RNase PH superfamily)
MQAADPKLLAAHVASEMRAGRRVPQERGAFDAPAKVSVTRDVVAGSVSSVAARVGTSVAIACVTAQVGPPAKDAPGNGVVEFCVTTSSLAEPVTPASRESQQTRSRVTGRILSGAFVNAVDLSKLCIREGEAAWTLKVDVRIMELDGDAAELCVAAAAAALEAVTIPAATIIDGSETAPVTIGLARKPAAVCVGLGPEGVLVVSPNMVELLAVDAVARVVVDASQPDAGILALEQFGRMPWSPSATEQAVSLAQASIAKQLE